MSDQHPHQDIAEERVKLREVAQDLAALSDAADHLGNTKLSMKLREWAQDLATSDDPDERADSDTLVAAAKRMEAAEKVCQAMVDYEAEMPHFGGAGPGYIALLAEWKALCHAE